MLHIILKTNWLNVHIPIKYLKIGDMNVVSIEKDAFNSEHFADLEELHFENLPLFQLYEGIFNGLLELKVLAFKRVKFYTFQRDILQPTVKLEKIFIQNCGQQKINVENLFETNTGLIEVEVSNCCLSNTIKKNTFVGLQSVRNLNLFNNQIEVIGPQSFDVPLETLKNLNLEQNKLKTIPENLFYVKHDNNLNVKLAQNPWYCDCSLERGLRFFKGINELIKCETPTEFHGRLLSQCSTDCHMIPIEEITSEATTTITKPIQNNEGNDDKSELSDEVEPINEVTDNEEFEDDIIDTIPSRTFPPEDSCIIHCDLSEQMHPFRWKKDLYITKRLHNNNIRTRYARRAFKQPKVKTGSKIIKFKESNGKDTKKLMGCLCTDDMKLVFSKSKLAASNTYQFCWLHAESKEIIPLDCISFYSFPKKKQRGGKDVWLRVKDKPIMIGLSILGAFLGIFIGLLIAVLLAIVFPKKIRKYKTESEYMYPTQRELEAMDRFRYFEFFFSISI